MSNPLNGRPPTLYFYDGRNLSLRDWAALAGMPIEILRGRLGGGMTLEEALVRPLATTTKIKAERSYTVSGFYSIEKAYRDWISSPAPTQP